MAAQGVLRTVEGGRVAFKCPGCMELHQIRVEGEGRPRWEFNGNFEQPTFRPSILVNGVQSIIDAEGEWTGEFVLDESGKPRALVCHSFVTDGQIQFLGDCTHALAGQTVPLSSEGL
ncbi:DUF6527 family protein [Bosea sp. LjRoot9]|uniref:DUF6527 family protein n=1 Tax=Bosea sp. LjRoot9 TaxID=3342341 RepID=UPI003ECE716B